MAGVGRRAGLAAGDDGSRRVLPGAQQLELLRRINLRRRRAVDPQRRRRLADRVLTTSAAGRGKADLPLLGLPVPGFGPAPVDPAELGAHELLRVASVLLADDLVALGADPVRTRLGAAVASSVPAGGRPRRRDRGCASTCAAAAVPRAGRGPSWSPSAPRSTTCSPTPGPSAASSTAASRGRSGCASGASATSSPRASTSPTPYAAGARAVPSSGSSPTSSGCPARSAYARLPQVRVPGADQAELARRVAAVVGLRVPAHERPAPDADAAATDPRQRRRARRRTRARARRGWRRPRHG